jgi:glycopeptide antibiotics resistance protein
MFSRFAVPLAVVALVFLGWVVLRLIRLTRRGEDTEAARLALRVGALWLVGLLLVTLGGRPQEASGQVIFNWVPFRSQSVVTSAAVLNALLFVPAGLLLPWIVRAALWRCVLVAFAGAVLLSSTIEVVQACTPLGTAFDITDVILNTLGAAVAVVVAGSAWKLSVASFTKKHEIRSHPAGRVGR